MTNNERALRRAILDTADAEGTVTPEGIVAAAAADPSSILYRQFPWDDAVAGHRHRIDIARRLISRYRIIRDLNARRRSREAKSKEPKEKTTAERAERLRQLSAKSATAVRLAAQRMPPEYVAKPGRGRTQAYIKLAAVRLDPQLSMAHMTEEIARVLSLMERAMAIEGFLSLGLAKLFQQAKAPLRMALAELGRRRAA
jgi:hypothetical protein